MTSPQMNIDPKLLELLRCPRCKGELELRQTDEPGFACQACALLYPLVEGIPNFLINEAKPLPTT